MTQQGQVATSQKERGWLEGVKQVEWGFWVWIGRPLWVTVMSFPEWGWWRKRGRAVGHGYRARKLFGYSVWEGMRVCPISFNILY